MRKINASINRQIAPSTHTPSRARKVAKSVDGEDNGFFKRRHVKGRREMRKMVFYIVNLTIKALPRKSLGQKLRDVHTLAARSQSLTDQIQWRQVRREIADLS